MNARSARALAALALTGCTTGQLLEQPAAQTYRSQRPRAVLADCLMDRLAGGDFRVHRQQRGGQTIVTATGIAGTYFVFTLSDSPGGGTDAAMRRANAVAPGLHNAQTCFEAP